MKQKRFLAPSLLVLPALLAFSPRASELGYHPAASSTLSKTIQSESQTTLEEMSMVQNGQEIDASMMGLEMTATTKFVVGVTDEYLAVEGSRPTRLSRTYDEISLSSEVASSNAMMGDSNAEMTGSSELQGVRVEFRWNGDEYVAAYPEGVDGDEDLLEGLTAQLDFEGLLPSAEVSEGDTWSIDPQELRVCFAPGGDVKIELESSDEAMSGMGQQPTPDQFIGDLEGEVTGEYAGTRTVDGVEVAVIKVTAEVSSNRDLSEMAGDMMGDAMEEQGIEMDIESMDSEFSFEGEGQLLWNLGAGVVHSFELSGEVTQTIDTSMQISAQGRDMAIEQSMSFGGSSSITVHTGHGS